MKRLAMPIAILASRRLWSSAGATSITTPCVSPNVRAGASSVTFSVVTIEVGSTKIQQTGPRTMGS